jgi:release factor glutamine methyltransferase
MGAVSASRHATPGTVQAALDDVAARLKTAGIDRPQAEARILLEAAIGIDRAAIIARPERSLLDSQRHDLEAMTARRCAREPISRILGRKEFWSLSFAVTPATLDPRPDSETLVAAVLERIADPGAERDILDLGTGTGCLLLALLSELPRAHGTGVDIDSRAVEVAAANAEQLGLSKRARFVVGNWARDISARFDVVVSNPPYVESKAIEGLAPEVSNHDPRRALDGGLDGLDAYRALVPDATRLLKSGGLLALEVGAGQAEAVRKIALEAGFSAMGAARDLAGIERCLLFSR